MKYFILILLLVGLVGCKGNKCYDITEFRKVETKEEESSLKEEIHHLRRVLKKEPEYCEICNERILEKYWLDEKEKFALIEGKWAYDPYRKSKSPPNPRDSLVLGTVYFRGWLNEHGEDLSMPEIWELSELAMPICEECAKMKINWLAKQYYERRCK